MLFSLAFIPNFLLGGVTGVMLAMASADYQYHNLFLSSSLPLYIGYWCSICLLSWFNLLVSKMMGYKLNETLNKWCFWLFMIGFNVCFLPQFILGLEDATSFIHLYAF